MGLLKKYPQTMGTVHSPPVEGWQAQPDGVVAAYQHSLYIHPIYGNQNQMAQAVGFVQT